MVSFELHWLQILLRKKKIISYPTSHKLFVVVAPISFILSLLFVGIIL